MPSNGLGTNGVANGVGDTLGKRKRPAPTPSNGDDKHTQEDVDEDEESRQVKRRGIVPESGLNGDISNGDMPSKAVSNGVIEQSFKSASVDGGGNGVERDVIVLDEDEDTAGAITIEDDD